jgi:hypothetical protein
MRSRALAIVHFSFGIRRTAQVVALLDARRLRVHNRSKQRIAERETRETHRSADYQEGEKAKHY